MLHIVPTPVGNLEDITLRALRILKEADLILAEDTRTTGILLSHFDIKNRLLSYHKFNEHAAVSRLVERMQAGEDMALVSDAGTPGISDPGFLIARECVAQGVEVECLPGATAFVPALVGSGLPCDKFVFEGFLPQKKGRTSRLAFLQEEVRTMVFYESPRRLKTTLELMLAAFGNRKISIVREISKLHEEIIRDSIENVTKIIDDIKGEIVIVVEKKKNNKLETISTNYIELVKEMQEEGYSKKDAIKEVSLKYNISKNKLYEECKEL